MVSRPGRSHPMVRGARRFGLPALVLLTNACGPAKPPVETVWTMPTNPPASDVDPAAARSTPPPGYPWAQAHAGGRGADSVWPESGQESARRGDLPETARTAPGGIWRKDERRAWQEARELDLGLVVQFWAEWSAAAVGFERETLHDPQVITAIEACCVPIKVDVTEPTMENREQLDRYRVHQLPTVILLDRRGQELERFGHAVDSAAFLEALKGVGAGG
ncbi:MAG: hypothetical protein JRI68_29655 [Deltaproteobacteria bacterium]|nr:hypothetical protein [Deltaproteobacteria bacterium]